MTARRWILHDGEAMDPPWRWLLCGERIDMRMTIGIDMYTAFSWACATHCWKVLVETVKKHTDTSTHMH